VNAGVKVTEDKLKPKATFKDVDAPAEGGSPVVESKPGSAEVKSLTKAEAKAEAKGSGKGGGKKNLNIGLLERLHAAGKKIGLIRSFNDAENEEAGAPGSSKPLADGSVKPAADGSSSANLKSNDPASAPGDAKPADGEKAAAADAARKKSARRKSAEGKPGGLQADGASKTASADGKTASESRLKRMSKKSITTVSVVSPKPKVKREIFYIPGTNVRMFGADHLLMSDVVHPVEKVI